MRFTLLLLVLSLSTFAFADDLKMHGVGFRIIGEGTYDEAGRRPYSVMIYWVPNGAIGKCIENNGQGSYTVYKPEGSTTEVVNFRCSVPIGRRWDIQQKIGTRVIGHIGGYHWKLDETPRNDLFSKYDFFGNLRRKHKDIITGYDKNPNVHYYYQGAWEVHPDKYPGVLFARIEFYCSSRDDNYEYCTESNLRSLARTLSTEGTGEHVQTLGKIGKYN